jgi:hypothetical protein
MAFLTCHKAHNRLGLLQRGSNAFLEAPLKESHAWQ